MVESNGIASAYNKWGMVVMVGHCGVKYGDVCYSGIQSMVFSLFLRCVRPLPNFLTFLIGLKMGCRFLL